MTIDTILYEINGGQSGIALMGEGRLKELEFVSGGRAAEGNIYLGKVVRKLDLAQLSLPLNFPPLSWTRTL